MNFYPIIRSLLFKLEPEAAHQLTLNLVRLAGEVGLIRWMLERSYRVPSKPVQVFGLEFPNPIGLAAGYDKDGTGWRGLSCLGFGHIEVGTVTPKPQEGNPKPRLFRLKEEQALINRMGFPGNGAEFVIEKVRRERPNKFILGINIGKNKDTPLESAAQDYIRLFNAFSPHADYITVNISSPNTVGLRQLQEKQALNELLTLLNAERLRLNSRLQHKLPILVKLAPDLTDRQLDEALDAMLANQVDGVIATNTTVSRDVIKSPLAKESGGLSGVPLYPKSLEMVSKIHARTGGRLPIVGAGGIHNATSVQKMMDAGAILVQIYTALVYEGPGLVKRIILEL